MRFCDLVAEHGTETRQTVLGRIDRFCWSFEIHVTCESESCPANGVTQITETDARDVKRQHNESAGGEDSSKFDQGIEDVLTNEWQERSSVHEEWPLIESILEVFQDGDAEDSIERRVRPRKVRQRGH